MHAAVAAKLAEVGALCRDLGIRRLDLFGSAVGESFDPESSDVDFLVEFDIRPGFDYFGTYFGLKEGLERILGRPGRRCERVEHPQPVLPRPRDADP